MKLYSLLALVLLSPVALAQFPPPVFPPITFNTVLGGNCLSSQPNDLSPDAQRTLMYTNVPPATPGTPVAANHWITHETWCASNQGGNYLPIIFIDSAPGGCWNAWVLPATVMGAPFVPGFNHLYMANAPISLWPTHMLAQPFDTYFYVGYQVPATLVGYGLIAQWVRLDPNGGLYLSAVRGYNVQ